MIIDCDPGHDDMVAIMTAHAAADIDLLGITTVAGNQTGEKTFLNARRVLSLINAGGVPLARGSDRPLTRALQVAGDIHGESGLDGADLPAPREQVSSLHAIDLMAELIGKSDRPVTLVPTGPLTNIALFLRRYPELASGVSEIVLMGGGVVESNVTPAAEFNIYVDPEAADIVFNSGLPLTMVGLDVTNRAMLDLDDIAKLKTAGGPVSRIVGDLLAFFASTYESVFGIAGAPLHDALAVVVAAAPDIVSSRDLHVAIETKGDHTVGRTVVDVYGVTGKAPNASVALDVDTARFRSIMFDVFSDLDTLHS
ncbi:MAG: nucleoside hydrolase [bacterium]